VLYNPFNEGEIPTFVAILEKAYQSSNMEICNNLPEPKLKEYHGIDYLASFPNRTEWFHYCKALVTKNPKACLSIGRGSEPNLQSNCQHFFQDLAEKENKSPKFCLQQFNSTYHSADEVRNCLWAWYSVTFGGRRSAKEVAVAESIAPFDEFDLELFSCLNAEIEQRDQFLFNFAQKTKNKKVCELIGITFGEYSRQNCLKALTE
jgi:hypothetical protein